MLVAENMEKVSLITRMGIHIMGISKMESKVDKERPFGKTETPMREVGLMIKSMGREYITRRKQEIYTMVNG